MPTVSDYLQQALSGGPAVGILAGTWVRLTNNVTAVQFISSSASSGTGLFTVVNVPSGSYSFATGPTNTGPWTTQDSNYIVGDTSLTVNVRDFGAVADGATDNSTALTNAIAG